ncbi:MAG: hypothetical protein Q7N50_11345 [Armatimonadota bacterium]|nr:hypothetical protein [Armatimonadota bacterium]
MAVSQGRFYQLVTYPLTQLSYATDSFVPYYVLRIASIVAAFVSFFLVVRSLGSMLIALLAATLLIGLMETGYAFNPFHALPLWFSFGLALNLFAIYCFKRHFTTGKQSWVYASAACFTGSALTYEPFVLYGASYVLIMLTERPKGSIPWVQDVRWWFSKLWPVMIMTGLYAVAYVAFRMVYPSQYPGTKLSLGTISSTVGTIFRLSLCGLNWTGLGSLFMPRELMRVSWISAIVAIGVGTTCARMVFLLASDDKEWKKVRCLACVSLLYLLLPNVLLSLTERYRDYHAFPLYYLTTFYSGFAATIIVAAFAIVVVRFSSNWRLRACSSTVVGAILCALTYGNFAESERIYANHRLERQKWAFVDTALAMCGAEKNIVLYFPQLSNSAVHDPYEYWEGYVQTKTNGNVTIVPYLQHGTKLDNGRKRVLACIAEYSVSAKQGELSLGELNDTANEIATVFNVRKAYLGSRVDNRGEMRLFRSSRVPDQSNLTDKERVNGNTFNYRAGRQAPRASMPDVVKDLRLIEYLAKTVDREDWTNMRGLTADGFRAMVAKNMLLKYEVSVNHANVKAIWND